MELKDLVPPLELCKQIPEGKFENSVLVWSSGYIKGNYVISQRGYGCGYIAPAPTLQEIMLALDEAGFFSPTCYRKANTWCVDCEDDPVDEEASKLPCLFDAEDRDNAATAALKLWMELKGEE